MSGHKGMSKNHFTTSFLQKLQQLIDNIAPRKGYCQLEQMSCNLIKTFHLKIMM